MTKKSKPKQVEIKFDAPESFRLVVQQSTDGDRIAAEQAQSQINQTESEKLQQTLT